MVPVTIVGGLRIPFSAHRSSLQFHRTYTRSNTEQALSVSYHGRKGRKFDATSCQDLPVGDWALMVMQSGELALLTLSQATISLLPPLSFGWLYMTCSGLQLPSDAGPRRYFMSLCRFMGCNPGSSRQAVPIRVGALCNFYPVSCRVNDRA